MDYQKKCKHCGKLFTAHRSDTKYCGNSCRVLATYKRNKEHNERFDQLNRFRYY